MARPLKVTSGETHMRSVIRTGILATGLACLQVPAASGQELIAAWEGDQARGYTFVSVVFSVGGPVALTVSPTASFLYYEVPDGTDRTRVRSPGASIAAGLRVRTARVTMTAGLGFETRRTVRESGPGPGTLQQESGLIVHGTVFAQATRLTNINAIVSYSNANQYIWARGGLKQQLTNRRFRDPVALAVGIETTAQGNADVRAYQAGGVFEIAFVRAAGSVQLRAGLGRHQYRDGTAERRPYFGIGFYRAW